MSIVTLLMVIVKGKGLTHGWDSTVTDPLQICLCMPPLTLYHLQNQLRSIPTAASHNVQSNVYGNL